MKIRFANGFSMDYIEAYETEEYFNGSSRRVLTFYCDPSNFSIDSLNKELSDENNTKSIQLINEDMGITNIYEGYVLKLKLGIEPYQINNDPPMFEDRVVFKLGKRTVIEQKLNELGIL